MLGHASVVSASILNAWDDLLLQKSRNIYMFNLPNKLIAFRYASSCKNRIVAGQVSCKFTEVMLQKQNHVLFPLHLGRQGVEAETAKRREECRAEVLKKQNQTAQNTMAKQAT